MRRRWLLPICALALVSCNDSRPGPPAIAADAGRVTCVNRASGASWQIVLDRARHLAAGRPARMAGGRVRWSDPHDGSEYELDTTSGDLTMTRASSTGGYMVDYRCSSARIRGRG